MDEAVLQSAGGLYGPPADLFEISLRCVCDIFNAVLNFGRDVRHFAFWVCNSWICVKFRKKRGKVLKMSVSN